VTDDDPIIDRVALQLDPATATIVVSEIPEERQFIGEALLLAAGLFLLAEYASGFLDGLGLKDEAKAHGAAARAWLAHLHSGQPSDADLARQRQLVGRVLGDIRPRIGSEAAVSAAEGAVRRYLRSAGAAEGQSAHAARTITDNLKKP
jgi:hypothetical protein